MTIQNIVVGPPTALIFVKIQAGIPETDNSAARAMAGGFDFLVDSHDAKRNVVLMYAKSEEVGWYLLMQVHKLLLLYLPQCHTHEFTRTPETSTHDEDTGWVP